MCTILILLLESRDFKQGKEIKYIYDGIVTNASGGPKATGSSKE